MHDEVNPYESPRSEEPVGEQHLQAQDLVTIATFHLPVEAELAAAMLEREGFRAQLADVHTDAANVLWSNAIGGVKLMVMSGDAERAADFLQTHADQLKRPAELGEITFDCEECGAPLVMPGDRRGKVETCPKCRAFIDVPD